MLAHKELKTVIQDLLSKFDFQIQETQLQDGWIVQTAPKSWFSLMQALNAREKIGVVNLILITARRAGQKFELIGELEIENISERISVRTMLSANDELDSITSLWTCAGRFEREVHERYGVAMRGDI